MVIDLGSTRSNGGSLLGRRVLYSTLGVVMGRQPNKIGRLELPSSKESWQRSEAERNLLRRHGWDQHPWRKRFKLPKVYQPFD